MTRTDARLCTSCQSISGHVLVLHVQFFDLAGNDGSLVEQVATGDVILGLALSPGRRCDRGIGRLLSVDLSSLRPGSFDGDDFFESGYGLPPKWP